MSLIDIDTISEDFEWLDNWEQRYQYLTELGEQLPPMPNEMKIESNLVKACMSRVWVCPTLHHDKTVTFQGDCDTVIIKGVVALLIRLFAGKTIPKILKIDVDKLFKRIKLSKNLSPSRHVGIYAIVDVMKSKVSKLEAKN